MPISTRATRWPSALETFAVVGARKPVRVVVRNVSATGLKCLSAEPADIGDAVRLQVGETTIRGRVTRHVEGGFAIAFLHHIDARILESLRQARDAAPPPQTQARPIDEQDLLADIRKIL